MQAILVHHVCKRSGVFGNVLVDVAVVPEVEGLPVLVVFCGGGWGIHIDDESLLFLPCGNRDSYGPSGYVYDSGAADEFLANKREHPLTVDYSGGIVLDCFGPFLCLGGFCILECTWIGCEDWCVVGLSDQ